MSSYGGGNTFITIQHNLLSFGTGIGGVWKMMIIFESLICLLPIGEVWKMRIIFGSLILIVEAIAEGANW